MDFRKKETRLNTWSNVEIISSKNKKRQVFDKILRLDHNLGGGELHVLLVWHEVVDSPIIEKPCK